MPHARVAFHPGQEVLLVDARTGEPIELVHVTRCGPDGVEIAEYTARFAADGQGLPHAQRARVQTAAVVGLDRRVLHAAADEWVTTRVLTPRHHIRPATAKDRRHLAERAEAERLVGALEERFHTIASRGQPRLDLARLRAICRLSGVDPATVRAAP